MTIRERFRLRWKEWVPAGLAVVMLVLTVIAYVELLKSRMPIPVSFTTGGQVGFRYHLFHTLPKAAQAHGLRVVTELENSSQGVARVDAGKLDFAFVQGGFDLSRHPNLRLAAPMVVESMHLLVKESLVQEISEHLGALKGKVILVGASKQTGGHWMALEILKFIGLKPDEEGSPGDFRAVSFPVRELTKSTPADKWPDALFLMSIPPGAEVKRLVTSHGYRLVALPIARAFTMSGHLSTDSAPKPSGGQPSSTETVRRECAIESTLPAYTYQVDPAVPPAALQTIGTRSLLITHRGVRPEVVERMLDTLYDDSFRRLFNPPFDSALLHEAQEIPLHAGAKRYRDRSKPLVTESLVGMLANAVTIVAPLTGTLLFVWQWSRQLTRRNRERTFEESIMRVSDLETRAAAEELSSAPDLDRLLELQRELARLKAEVIDRFCQVEIFSDEQLVSFSIQVNDARDYLSRLIAQQRGGQGESPRSGHAGTAIDSGTDSTR